MKPLSLTTTLTTSRRCLLIANDDSQGYSPPSRTDRPLSSVPSSRNRDCCSRSGFCPSTPSCSSTFWLVFFRFPRIDYISLSFIVVIPHYSLLSGNPCWPLSPSPSSPSPQRLSGISRVKTRSTVSGQVTCSITLHFNTTSHFFSFISLYKVQGVR